MGLQIVTPRQSLPRKQAHIATSNRKVDNEVMEKKYDEIYVEWAPNEKVGVEVAVGASIGGVRSLSCMKHVGLNVAADPFFTAAYTGVTGGAVVLVADDNGCHSSQNEQDSRYYGRSAGVPVLEPSNAQECKDYLKLAYEISEKYDTVVLLRSNTRVSFQVLFHHIADRLQSAAGFLVFSDMRMELGAVPTREYHIPAVSLSWAKELKKIVSRMKRTSRSTWQCRRWPENCISHRSSVWIESQRTRRTSLSA